MKVDNDLTKKVAEKVGSDKSGFLLSETSLAVMESLTMPLVQEVVISADLRCTECQKRINSVISRFNAAEMESVVVNLLEKKMVVTCKYVKAPSTQITTTRQNFFAKVALIKRIFRSSKP